MKKYEICVEDEVNERIDSFLARELKKVSRTSISKFIKKGLVFVNNKKIKPKYIVKKNDIIKVNLPVPEKIELKPEDIKLDIIYEDSDIAIVNKPKEMVVHPAKGNESGTLVNALLYQVGNLSSENSKLRPGIVHRLDKDTSGALVVAKNNIAYRSLLNQFKKRTIKRKYIALVYGEFSMKEATISAPIGRNPINRKKMIVIDKNSKEAISHYKVLEEFENYTLVEISLETGRTHQIRVHMSYIEHPVVGDQIYSTRKNEFGVKTQLLHASTLGFIHPASNKYIEIQAEIPKYFKEIIRLLEIRDR